MKRFFSICIVVFFLFVIGACAKVDPSPPEGNPSDDPIAVEDPTSPSAYAVIATNEPTVTLTQDPFTVYDAHDYSILRSFFELTDENGITNGAKCFTSYDPDDPATWTGGINDADRSIIWNTDGKVRGINLRNSEDELIHLAGNLEFSSLDKLEYVIAWDTVIEELIAEDLPAFAIRSSNTNLQLPYVEGEAILRGGYLERFFLRSAAHVRCEITGKAVSNVSNLPCFTVDITVDGAGYAGAVGCSDENYYVVWLSAQPKDGAQFIGWFNEDGELISAEADLELTDPATGTFPNGAPAGFSYTARFE